MDYVDLGGPCYWSEGLIGLLQLPRSELERYHDVHQRLQQVGLLGTDCLSPIPGCLALVEATALPEDPLPGLLSSAALASSDRLQPELRLKLIAKLHADEAAGSRTAIFQDGSWVPVDSISNAVLEQLPAETRTAVLQEFGSSLGATPLPVLYTYAQVLKGVDRLLLVKDLLPFAEQLDALPPGDISQLEPVVALRAQVQQRLARGLYAHTATAILQHLHASPLVPTGAASPSAALQASGSSSPASLGLGLGLGLGLRLDADSTASTASFMAAASGSTTTEGAAGSGNGCGELPVSEASYHSSNGTPGGAEETSPLGRPATAGAAGTAPGTTAAAGPAAATGGPFGGSISPPALGLVGFGAPSEPMAAPPSSSGWGSAPAASAAAVVGSFGNGSYNGFNSSLSLSDGLQRVGSLGTCSLGAGPAAAASSGFLPSGLVLQLLSPADPIMPDDYSPKTGLGPAQLHSLGGTSRSRSLLGPGLVDDSCGGGFAASSSSELHLLQLDPSFSEDLLQADLVLELGAPAGAGADDADAAATRIPAAGTEADDGADAVAGGAADGAAGGAGAVPAATAVATGSSAAAAGAAAAQEPAATAGSPVPAALIAAAPATANGGATAAPTIRSWKDIAARDSVPAGGVLPTGAGTTPRLVPGAGGAVGGSWQSLIKTWAGPPGVKDALEAACRSNEQLARHLAREHLVHLAEVSSRDERLARLALDYMSALDWARSDDCSRAMSKAIAKVATAFGILPRGAAGDAECDASVPEVIRLWDGPAAAKEALVAHYQGGRLQAGDIVLSHLLLLAQMSESLALQKIQELVRMRPKLCARVPAYFTTICATAIHNAAAATRKVPGAAGSTSAAAPASSGGAAPTAAAVLKAADVRASKDQAGPTSAAAAVANGVAAAAVASSPAAKPAAKASRSGRIAAQAKLDELMQGQPPLPPALRGAIADAGTASPALLEHLDAHHLSQLAKLGKRDVRLACLAVQEASMRSFHDVKQPFNIINSIIDSVSQLRLTPASSSDPPSTWAAAPPGSNVPGCIRIWDGPGPVKSALVSYFKQGMLRLGDLDSCHLGMLAEMPPGVALAAVQELVTLRDSIAYVPAYFRRMCMAKIRAR